MAYNRYQQYMSYWRTQGKQVSRQQMLEPLFQYR